MTTYHELASTVGLGLACFVVAALLLRKLRRYLQPRQKGEDAATFWARARADQQLDKAAFVNMFGEGHATPHRINFALMLVWFWCVTKAPAITAPSLLYLLAGLWVTREVANAARRADFDRLGYSGRFWFRLFYAWSWPLNLINKTPPKAD
jgi:hypothetical protein